MKSQNITIVMEVDTASISGNPPSVWCTLSQTGGGSITTVPGDSSQDVSTVLETDTITWAGSANVPPDQATVNITSIQITSGTDPFGPRSAGTPGAYGTTIKATCITIETGAIYRINFSYNGTNYSLDPKITVNMGSDEN